jgi:hypothetical protein
MHILRTVSNFAYILRCRIALAQIELMEPHYREIEINV